MLMLLAQATHGHRAHLACGVLREHGVEAHVFHENSGVLHGGMSTTTASLWVHEEEWQDAREILATAPMEPIPEGNAESMNIPRDLFPPVEAVTVGVAGPLFVISSLVKLIAITPGISFLVPEEIVDTLGAFLLSLLVDAGTFLLFGMMVGLACAPAFAVIRWHRAQWWPAVALMALIGVMMALTLAFSCVQ